MIEYCYETSFQLRDEVKISKWIEEVVNKENKNIHSLVYIFCDDEGLLKLNKEYLDHDTYTDILTFPYEHDFGIHADIFISVPRVSENAKILDVDEEEEMKRVMIHGVLHLLGYDDHTTEEKDRMRRKEDEKLKMFHVEQ